jgi:hypothetical protein
MGPFEITVDNILYTIEPQKDQRYFVFEAGIKVGSLYAEDSDMGVVWRSAELLTEEQAQKIGQAIIKHEM